MPKKINAVDKDNFLKIFGDNPYYSIRKSCKEAKIGKSTFYRWSKDSEFKKKVKNLKTKRKERNVHHLLKRLRMNLRNLRPGGY